VCLYVYTRTHVYCIQSATAPHLRPYRRERRLRVNQILIFQNWIEPAQKFGLSLSASLFHLGKNRGVFVAKRRNDSFEVWPQPNTPNTPKTPHSRANQIEPEQSRPDEEQVPTGKIPKKGFFTENPYRLWLIESGYCLV